MKFFVVSLALSILGAAWGQDAPYVQQIDGPPGGQPEQTAYVYNGSDQLIGICWALSNDSVKRGRTQVAISAISKDSPAVITSTAHGIHAKSRPLVTISGATGTGWVTGINGTFVATVIDADTFSIPVDSSAFGTLGGTVVFTTTGPRTSVAEWAVWKTEYDGTKVVWRGWLGGKRSFENACDNASSASAQQQ